MMHSRQDGFPAEFASPPARYRGAPFWSWNCLITKEMARQQICEFKRMGFGGFHIHVRVGLKNKYMDEDFLDLVAYCNEVAKEQGLLCYLYDEDRYASGIAGGEVTKMIWHRSRHLRITREWIPAYGIPPEEFVQRQKRNEKMQGCLLAAYDLHLSGDELLDVRLLEQGEAPQWQTWYVYAELAEESPWCNDQTYLDAMKKEAVADFMARTHEKYYAKLKDDFGHNIPSIFTDEPNIGPSRIPMTLGGQGEVILPYTEEMPVRYEMLSGMPFFEALPWVIWNSPDKPCPMARYWYYECCAQLFDEAYSSQIGQWCAAHGVQLTGHLLAEEELTSQAQTAGEAMRQYAAYQVPGIDNLCDLRQFSTAKQVSSVVHQLGLPGMMSEEYGVTQWDFDFKGYKAAGDWQAALGVTLRVPHLAWASMNGEAKRDYPAAIGWQSPWYRDYGVIEDYFARINSCLNRGKPQLRVAVLHPVESMWLCMGVGEKLARQRAEMEQSFQHITELLLLGGIDFDYVSEEIWCREPVGEGLTVGQMKYDVMLIPGCIHLREEVLRRLHAAAGKAEVIFVGQTPEWIGNRPATADDLSGMRIIQQSDSEILRAVEAYREIEIYRANGTRAREYLHQFRQEGETRWLFIAHAWTADKARGERDWSRRPRHAPEKLTIRIRGEGAPVVYNALNGCRYRMPYRLEQGNTVLRVPFFDTDSLLLQLQPAPQEMEHLPLYQPLELSGLPSRVIPQPVAYENEEPNVCLLDTFEYALDGEDYHLAEELLRVDNIVRARLGYRQRKESVVQPYISDNEERPYVLHLRRRFWSDAEAEGCMLALEELEHCQIRFNGQEVPNRANGWYVDAAIQTVALPKVQKGENMLEIRMRFGEKTNLEWMYLLGEFGVEVHGNQVRLTEKPGRLFWGDYTRQGFPFYTGNMKYVVQADAAGRTLQVPYFSGAAVRVEAGGKQGIIAFLPYAYCLPDGLAEDATITLTLLGNRYNGFGQLHMIGDDVNWLGPDSWRTEGTSWSDAYQLKPMGILTAPLLYETGKSN